VIWVASIVTRRTQPPPSCAESKRGSAGFAATEVAASRFEIAVVRGWRTFVMNRIVRSSVLALALCTLSLVGCESKRVWLQLTGLDDGNAEGIWLWRLSEQSGAYERTCRIVFGQPVYVGESEWLDYTQHCGEASGGLNTWRTALKRSPESPETVTIGLWYTSLEDPGAYKVSSYGLYGETSLSESTLPL
jgi:hypothetical protein